MKDLAGSHVPQTMSSPPRRTSMMFWSPYRMAQSMLSRIGRGRPLPHPPMSRSRRVSAISVATAGFASARSAAQVSSTPHHRSFPQVAGLPTRAPSKSQRKRQAGCYLQTPTKHSMTLHRRWMKSSSSLCRGRLLRTTPLCGGLRPARNVRTWTRRPNAMRHSIAISMRLPIRQGAHVPDDIRVRTPRRRGECRCWTGAPFLRWPSSVTSTE